MPTFSHSEAEHKPPDVRDLFSTAFDRTCRTAGHLRAAGRDEDDILAILQENNRAHGMPLTPRRVQRIARWIATKPAGRRSPTRQVPDATFLLWLQQARDTAFPRGTFSRRTCRTVFLVLLGIMERTGSLTVSASCREVAELTGFRFKTVARALHTLSHPNRRGIPVLLRCFTPHRSIHPHPDGKRLFVPANAYTLLHNAKGAKKTQSCTPPDVSSVCVSFAPFLPDAFRGRAGLSKTRWYALVAVKAGGVKTAKELATVLGVCLRTAKACLHDLRAEGLLAKAEGVYRCTGTSVEEVAQRRGSAGQLAKQKAEHDWQRERLIDRLVKQRGRLRRRAKPAPDPVWDGEDFCTDAEERQVFKRAASFHLTKRTA
jgi:hypothetical protein